MLALPGGGIWPRQSKIDAGLSSLRALLRKGSPSPSDITDPQDHFGPAEYRVELDQWVALACVLLRAPCRSTGTSTSASASARLTSSVRTARRAAAPGADGGRPETSTASSTDRKSGLGTRPDGSWTPNVRAVGRQQMHRQYDHHRFAGVRGRTSNRQSRRAAFAERCPSRRMAFTAV